MKTHTTPKNFNIWVEFNAIFLKRRFNLLFYSIIFQKKEYYSDNTKPGCVVFLVSLWPSQQNPPPTMLSISSIWWVCKCPLYLCTFFPDLLCREDSSPRRRMQEACIICNITFVSFSQLGKSTFISSQISKYSIYLFNNRLPSDLRLAELWRSVTATQVVKWDFDKPVKIPPAGYCFSSPPRFIAALRTAVISLLIQQGFALSLTAWSSGALESILENFLLLFYCGE